MKETSGDPGATSPPAPRAAARVGCVSFLNAKPLIDGLAPQEAAVCFDVPSGLLAALESQSVDIALCPVIDYFRSRVPLRVVPVGGISCEGPTLTVRLFSRVPPQRITTVHADTDSHTSVALLQVLLSECHGIRPRIHDMPAADANRTVADPNCEAVMLIGDKVVTSPPPRGSMPHELDLGELWHQHTGLPFVFAIWMCRHDHDPGDLPARLDALRKANASRIDQIVQRHAAAHGWPADLARRYLGELLHHDITDRDREAVEHFAARAAALGIIDDARLPLTAATSLS
jgi:chorismate dehydratase